MAYELRRVLLRVIPNVTWILWTYWRTTNGRPQTLKVRWIMPPQSGQGGFKPNGLSPAPTCSAQGALYADIMVYTPCEL